MAPKHFLDLDRLDGQTLQQILALGADYKRGEWPTGPHPLAGKTLAMIFEKPSTRTRVSFEVGMLQLGGHAIILSNSDLQLGRGETIADTARVLSRYADAIMIRTNKPEKLLELARHASVPVINGLTDASHPCQVMADIMTFQERRGPLEGRVVAWTGDGNNVACSWIQATVHFGFEMRLACPPELAPPAAVLAWARDNGGRVSVTTNPVEAVRGADAVITDTWVSMGQTDKGRHALLTPYQVNDALMGQAHPEAVFMHCLPAHRGEEVTDSVMDGPQSVVWDEAENRLHAQKGILTWCMS